MKKTALLTLCTIFPLILTAGCVPGSVAGRGTSEEYSFEVNDFTKIQTALFCNVEYYYSPVNSVTLKIQPNLLEHITVEVSNGTLIVSSKRSISWSGTSTPTLTVSSPVLTGLDLNGAGEFAAHDKITGESFTLSLDGAGSGSAELDVDVLNASIAGAGSFNLSGRADTASLRLDGTGRFNALSLQTKDADISIAGSGAVSIACSDNLKVDAAGIGEVQYRGSPELDVTRGGIVRVNRVD